MIPVYAAIAAEPPEMRVEINAPGIRTFSLSPDGQKIVYSADTDTGRQLWIRFLDRVAPQPLRGTDGGFAAFWSPDRRAIGFFTSNSLRRLDLERGESTSHATTRSRPTQWPRPI